MAYVILAIILYIGIVWCLAMKFLAWAGGWQRLAKAFPASGIPEGQKLGLRWIKVGWIDYNGCVSYVVNSAGLHVSLWPLFNLGHPPLFIPWSAMRVERVGKEFLRRGQVIKLTVGEPVVARICVPEAVFEAGKRSIAEVAPEEIVVTALDEAR